MNFREGTRRLAVLLGAVGAILGGFASYVELQSVIVQRASYNKFEQLAQSQAVRDARNCLKGVLSERGCNELKTGPWDNYRVSPFFPNSQAIRRVATILGRDDSLRVPPVPRCQVQGHPLQFVSGHPLQVAGTLMARVLQSVVPGVTIGAIR